MKSPTSLTSIFSLKTIPSLKILIAILFLVFVMAENVKSQINKRNVEQEWSTDTGKANIELDELWILLKRDGITPVDEPEFLSESEARGIFFANEPVILVNLESEPKAYPLSILTYHEIVNDRSGDSWFTVTFCPLCNSSVVFNRKLDFMGKTYTLDFGTSGMLRKSNLVMWDRQTESWWQQITGSAVSGELTGAELEMLPSQIITLDEFYRDYPDGKMLSTSTGQNKDYGSNPYVDYDNPENTQPRLFGEEVDSRMLPMERVIHVFGSVTPKVYPLSILQEKSVINDVHEGIKLVIFYQDGAVSILDKKEISESKNVGTATVFNPVVDNVKLQFKKADENFVDKQSGSVWTVTGKCISGDYEGTQLKTVVYGNHFAFAWLAFYPETIIYSD